LAASPSDLPCLLPPSLLFLVKPYPLMMWGGKGDSPRVSGGAVCVEGVAVEVGKGGGVAEEDEEVGTVVGVSSGMPSWRLV